MLITGVLFFLALHSSVQCSIDESEVLQFANKIKEDLPFNNNSEYLSEIFYAKIGTNPDDSFQYTGDVYQSYVDEFKTRYAARLDLEEFNKTKAGVEILEITESQAVLQVSIFFDQILNKNLSELWKFRISCRKTNEKLIVEKLQITPLENDIDQRKLYSMDTFLNQHSKWMTILTDHKTDYIKGHMTWDDDGTTQVTITAGENIEAEFRKAKNRSLYSVNDYAFRRGRQVDFDGKILNVSYLYVYGENAKTDYMVINYKIKAEYNNTFDRFDFIQMVYYRQRKPTPKELTGNLSLTKILHRQNPL